MISTADIRASVVALLKASDPLTDLVSDDIREESWMGRAYTYPNVRVYVTRFEPLGMSGNCPMFDCGLLVSYRDAGTSSTGCADGMKIACEALVGRKLLNPPVFTSVTPVIFDSMPDPIPESEDAWLARAFLSCRLREVV